MYEVRALSTYNVVALRAKENGVINGETLFYDANKHIVIVKLLMQFITMIAAPSFTSVRKTSKKRDGQKM